MTAFLIVAACLAYLAVGVGVARLYVWRNGSYNKMDEPEAVLIPLLWAVALPFVLLGAFGYGIFRLVTLPPLRVRRERRHARLVAEIARLERELDIKDDLR